MDSARNWWGRTLLLSGAAAATAGLFYLGTGLHPMPWLTWLAPLPALLIAPRISLPAATAVAFTGYLVGLAGYGRYLLADLEIPGPAVIGILTGVSMIFTVVVLLFRGLLRRGWALTAAVVAPAAWTSAEFLMGRLGPYGANWSLANAQADLLPILQTASITGVYGVSFLIFGTAAAIAVVAAPRIDDQRRVVTLLVAVAVLAVALGFGAIRLAQSPSTPTVRVALVAAHGAGNVPEVGTMEARSRMAAGLSWLRDHETQQGMIIVFPEKDFAVDQNTLPAVITAFGAVAHRKQATIVLGLEHHTGSDIFNTASSSPPTAPSRWFTTSSDPWSAPKTRSLQEPAICSCPLLAASWVSPSAPISAIPRLAATTLKPGPVYFSSRHSTSRWMTGRKAESSCFAASSPDSPQFALPTGLPHYRRPVWPHHRRDTGRRRRPGDRQPDSRRSAQLGAHYLRPRRRRLQLVLPDHHRRLDPRPRGHTCRRTSLTP